jgi:hypothetical protein
MYKCRAVYVILTGLFVMCNCLFIYAQTAEGANLKARPQLLQSKPQTDIQKAQTEALIKSLPKDRQKTFKAVSSIMANQLIESFKSNKPENLIQDDAMKIVAAGMEKTAIITNTRDADVLVKNTMMAINHGFQVSILELSVKIESSQHIFSILREEIVALQDVVAEWPENNSIRELTYRECSKLPDGSYEIVERTRVMSKEQVIALIEKMKNQLSTLGDDSQLANIDLQNMLQKQQQTIQMLSNISKVLHDTALAVIRKIG